MTTNKFYTVEKEINGTKYVAQFNGISAAVSAIDETYIDGTTTTSIKKLSEYLFDKVIVEPKGLTMDDFDSMDEFNEVITFAREVMQGDFRKKKDPGTTEGTGK